MNILDIREPLLDETKVRFADTTSLHATLLSQCANHVFISLDCGENSQHKGTPIRKEDIPNLIKALKHVQENW
jgi:hypothetical protein